DRARDALVLYGGLTSNYLADSWRLPLSGTPAWEPLIVPVRPPARTHHTAILDRTSNRLITFGGANEDGAQTNDVWSLTLGTLPIWTPITPATPGGAPAARRDAASIFDPVRNRMILFGGWRSSGSITDQFLSDTWQLALGETPDWSPLSSASPPPGRTLHALAYDELRDRVLVQDGYGVIATGNPTYLGMFDDVYARPLDGSSPWGILAPEGASPGAREAQVSIFDPDLDRLISYAVFCLKK